MATGCENRERHALWWPVGVGCWELVGAGLRSGCRKQHPCSRTSRQRLCFPSIGRGGADVGAYVLETGRKYVGWADWAAGCLA